MLTAPQRWQQKVVDIGGWNNESGGWLHVWNRTTANIWQAINKQWRVEKAGAGSKIVSMMNGLCLVVQSNVVGAHAVTDTCASGGATWTFAGGQLRLLAPTTALITQHAPLCLSVVIVVCVLGLFFHGQIHNQAEISRHECLPSIDANSVSSFVNLALGKQQTQLSRLCCGDNTGFSYNLLT